MYQQKKSCITTQKDFSTRQLEILQLLAKGLQNAEIADHLYPSITEGGVKQHLHRIYAKMQVNNRIEAVNKFRNSE